MRQSFLGFLDPIQIFASLVVLFLSLPVHAFVKSYTAKRLGDPSADNAGRMTLNPFAHIDVMGAIALVLFRFGWSQPIPIDSRNLKKPKRDLGLISLAGIGSYLGIGFIFSIPTVLLNKYLLLQAPEQLMTGSGTAFVFSQLFYYIVIINIQLGVLNLIPIMPFDGGNILLALLPDQMARSLYQFFRRYQGAITVILLVLLYVGLLGKPLAWLSGKIASFFFNIVGAIVY